MAAMGVAVPDLLKAAERLAKTVRTGFLAAVENVAFLLRREPEPDLWECAKCGSYGTGSSLAHNCIVENSCLDCHHDAALHDRSLGGGIIDPCTVCGCDDLRLTRSSIFRSAGQTKQFGPRPRIATKRPNSVRAANGFRCLAPPFECLGCVTSADCTWPHKDSAAGSPPNAADDPAGGDLAPTPEAGAISLPGHPNDGIREFCRLFGISQSVIAGVFRDIADDLDPPPNSLSEGVRQGVEYAVQVVLASARDHDEQGTSRHDAIAASLRRVAGYLNDYAAALADPPKK